MPEVLNPTSEWKNSAFTRPLILEKVSARLWRVHHEFGYWAKLSPEELIIVPEGFLTDLASVPRPFWVLIPPDGEYTAAAVVHDLLYSIQDRKRSEADAIFLWAMRDLGVPTWKRLIMYRAVRFGGFFVWNRRLPGGISVAKGGNI